MNKAIVIAAAAAGAYIFRAPLASALGITLPATAPLTAAQAASVAASNAAISGAPPPAQAVAAAVAATATTGQAIASASTYTVDAAGFSTEYTDAQLLDGLNTLAWAGLANIPAEQIARIDPAILSRYAATTSIQPGSVLAYLLGVGGLAPQGTTMQGTDGHSYQMSNGMYTRMSGLPRAAQYR
jgi:hypothetical protein